MLTKITVGEGWKNYRDQAGECLAWFSFALMLLWIGLVAAFLHRQNPPLAEDQKVQLVAVTAFAVGFLALMAGLGVAAAKDMTFDFNAGIAEISRGRWRLRHWYGVPLDDIDSSFIQPWRGFYSLRLRVGERGVIYLAKFDTLAAASAVANELSDGLGKPVLAGAGSPSSRS